MKIQAKLLLAFAAVAMMCAAVGIVGWWGISNLAEINNNFTATGVPELEGLGMVDAGINAVKSAERTILDKQLSAKDREKEIDKFAKRLAEVDEGMKLYSGTDKNQEERALNDKAQTELTAWKAEHEKFVSLARSLRSEEGANNDAIFAQMRTLTFGDLRASFYAIDASVKELKAATIRTTNEEGADGAKTATTNLYLNLSFTILCFLAAMGLGFWISRQITLPMVQGVKFAEEIAKGIFTSRLRLSAKGEIGQLAAALDHMAESLSRQVEVARCIAGGDLTVKIELSSPQDTLGLALQTMQQGLAVTITQTKLAGNEIANGALQIADSSQSLAQGASEQASSLEEISSAMTQMSSQTKMTADHANKAQELSNAASAAADNGNHQMQQMMEAMEEIRIASQSVANVIKVIEEIAFQTNMLALNAAVEAAHAGQHGKGFAVVAEEVRNLAARSAKAAKETADLIAGSVAKTENGAKIADQTAAALGEITERIAQSSDLVRSIAQAAREQSQGIDQVSQGLHQIDQVTQQNSANAEEGAAASEELSGQASHLNQLMQAFKVDSGNTVINPSQQMKRPVKQLGMA